MSGRGRGRGRGGRGAVPPSVASASFNYGSPAAVSSPSHSTGAIPSNPHLHTTKTEPSQRFPQTLIPEPPTIESFTDYEVKSVEYSDRLEALLKASPSFRPIKTDKAKIDRYSDKYLSHLTRLNDRKERLNSIKTNLDFFPEELHSVYGTAAMIENSSSKSKKAKSSSSSSNASLSVSFNETISHLDHLAQKEEVGGIGSASEESDKEENEAEDLEGEGLEEDEEFEDDTDYNVSYFDNGEDANGGDYDDNGNDEAIF